MSERAFDAEMLRSAIRIFNAFASRTVAADNVLSSGKMPAESVEALRTDLRREFGWVREALAENARAIDVSPRKVAWEGDGDISASIDMVIELMYLAYGRVWAKEYPEAMPRHWYESEEFPASLTLPIPVHASYVFNKKHNVIYLVAFAALTTAELCSKYVRVLVGTNKWEFASRIRLCAFHQPKTLHHLFLAQVSPNGTLLPGYPQKFCGSEHSNAYRQRKYRRSHAAPRKPK